MFSRTSSTSRTYAALAKAAATPPVLLLQHAAQLSPSAFRVVACHGPSRLELDEAAYNNMIVAATNKQFRLIPDTLIPLSDYSQQVVFSGIIEANTAIRDYDETYIKSNMRVMTANVFVDDSDQTIWRVVGDGPDKMLVQSVHEDFAALLNDRLVRRASQAVAASLPEFVVDNGDYIEYFHNDSGSLHWGFAMHSQDNKLQVFDRQDKELHAITTAHILSAADGNSLDKQYSLANRIQQENRDNHTVLADTITPSALNAYVDYMRTLFAGTEYFSQLEKLIKQRRTGGEVYNTIHD